MNHIYRPTSGSKEWAEISHTPEEEWSAKNPYYQLASRWESGIGFPSEIKSTFENYGEPFSNSSLLFGVPCTKCILESEPDIRENNLFVLAKSETKLGTFLVEEMFEKSESITISDWKKKHSESEKTKINTYFETLNINKTGDYEEIGYSFLSRMISVLSVADKFNAEFGLYLVHSFSEKNVQFDNYFKFMNYLLRQYNNHSKPHVNTIVHLTDIEYNNRKIALYSGWVEGKRKKV